VPWAAPLVLGDVVLLDVAVLLGAAVLLVLLPDDEAALAIAAPPPVRAAVTASVVSSGPTLRCKSFTSWLWGDSTMHRERRKYVGGGEESRRRTGGRQADPAQYGCGF
jgi:hypothetical protein